MKHHLLPILCGLLAAACSAPADPPAPNAEKPDTGVVESADVAEEEVGPDTVFGDSHVVFDFGQWKIPPGGEQYPCAQWTLNNEKPLYVNAVIQSNDGGFHHSNWYAVPDDQFEGPDGFFDCEDRGFRETSGAIFGEVVFAQSTQAYVETQGFPENVVIKIPPNSKIIGGLHLLNVSAGSLDTSVRMGLELVHPGDVETVVTPWRLDNSQLRIAANSEARFKTDCNLKSQYEYKTNSEFDPVIYWILPHYHALGNYFRVDLIKPDGDETILELSGFNAEANGVTFPTPIDVAGATGMRLVCGYQNPGDSTVWYGLEGDDEMCTLLAFTNAEMKLNTSVWEELEVNESEGMQTHVGKCSPLFIPKNPGQELPGEDEIEAPLYVPESNTDGEVTLVPDCEDTPTDAVASGETTLSAIRHDVLVAGCSYSSCHDSTSPAANLDFTAPDLHETLLGHDVLADVEVPLVDPGDPEGSWLYQIVSKCEPSTATGVAVAMPRNSPRLLPADQVARIRDWIAAGAPND